ncbi:glycosyltransferase [Shouchella shacheensis]|uniref:glycosyltransferase n=1 Tax=Shouchella shacheensis TaxID=1649580 RepID=UPI0007401EC0|nr:glycosyltransferase [Shouchella shacheensis]
MIKLLFIAKDTSQFIDRNFSFLEKELAKITHLTVWRKPGHIQYILNHLPDRPDFILLLNDIGEKMYPVVKGLSTVDIPSGLFVNDIHRFKTLRRNYIKKNNIQHIFTVARGKFLEIYPEYQQKMEWSPHFVHTEMFKDYGFKKAIDQLMMGAVNDYYPLRQKVLHSYKGDKSFVYHHHPGYRNYKAEEESHHFIAERYAQEINKAKIFFTCPSIFNYPVKKYFEVLACNSLLFAPTFKELEDLGFRPGTHFISIDAHNYREKAAYYLEHDAERERISEQGYNFVHQKHSTEVRAKQLLHKIKNRL